MSTTSPEMILGVQEPRILVPAPDRVSTSGPEAIDLAALAGLKLDPWQRLVMDNALAERADGKWSARDVAVIVSRQNGKGSIVEARQLAGLFLLNERLITYSAHEFKTAREAFLRLNDLIKGTPAFQKRVKRVVNNTFEVAIELVTGQRAMFIARSKGSGRGFTGDCVILDEAFNLDETAIDALLPTVSARPNPQIWFLTSAPDKELAPCLPVARLRSRALSDTPGRLAYHEWSIVPHDDMCTDACEEHDDPGTWESAAKANPSLGYRLTHDAVLGERDQMSPAGFLRERLGVGNYPPLDAVNKWAVVSEQVWKGLHDATSQLTDKVAFGIDSTPGGGRTCIAAYGARDDDLGHGEIIDHRAGTGWVVKRVKELAESWGPVAIVIDAAGPAAQLIPSLEAAGIEVTTPAARDVAGATGSIIAATGAKEGNEVTMRIVPHAALDAAVAGADLSPLADAEKWNRRSATVDISPIVSLTLARLGWMTATEKVSVDAWVL